MRVPALEVAPPNGGVFQAQKKYGLKELPMFTRQLAAMLSSGMPVVQSLDALEEQSSNKVMKIIIAGLRKEIEGGSSLSEALGKYPDVFDELFISMFQAGESSGMLAETAARIAGYLETAAELRRKVVSAMMYPSIVSVVAVLLTVSMLVFHSPCISRYLQRLRSETTCSNSVSCEHERDSS